MQLQRERERGSLPISDASPRLWGVVDGEPQCSPRKPGLDRRSAQPRPESSAYSDPCGMHTLTLARVTMPGSPFADMQIAADEKEVARTEDALLRRRRREGDTFCISPLEASHAAACGTLQLFLPTSTALGQAAPAVP